MIYKEIYNSVMLEAEFRSYGRDNYSNAAYDAMFELLEEGDEDYELDVIELCCAFSEYNEDEIIEYYGVDFKQYVDDLFYTEEYLEENGLDIDEMSTSELEHMFKTLYDVYEDEWREHCLDMIKLNNNVIELSNGGYLMIE